MARKPAAQAEVGNGSTPANSPKLKVEYRSLEQLIPYTRNARTHTDDQVAQLAGSIREFGWTNPILIDGDNGVIGGHARLLAARKLGIKTVPVIELHALTEIQKRAYILADNRLAENAEWDHQMLINELQDLEFEKFDFEKIGFANWNADTDFQPEGEQPPGLDEKADKEIECPNCHARFTP